MSPSTCSLSRSWTILSTMGRTCGSSRGGSRHAPPLDQARNWGQPSEEDTAGRIGQGEEQGRMATSGSPDPRPRRGRGGTE